MIQINTTRWELDVFVHRRLLAAGRLLRDATAPRHLPGGADREGAAGRDRRRHRALHEDARHQSRHQDPPPDARLLPETRPLSHAFRLGSEVTDFMLNGWLLSPGRDGAKKIICRLVCRSPFPCLAFPFCWCQVSVLYLVSVGKKHWQMYVFDN